jgi:hypothetical protein
MAYIDYTDKDVSMQKWLEEIAPNYFDFDTSELYMTSQFGYINEVMGTVENDTHHAVSIARREFYPTYAHYLKSFYKMAALQQISYPLANPATATAILILRESDILTYGTINENSGIYTFVLDNSAAFFAGNIPFMLDYPVMITAKEYKSAKRLSQVKYIYTARYTKDINNSLNTSYAKYMKSKVYSNGTETLLLLKVTLRQCTMTTFSQYINASPLISNLSMDFNVGKYMCNFEAFYKEANKQDEQQLYKLPLNSNPYKGPYCEWQMIDDETLRITFPNNPYFNPTYNSQIVVNVYTTMGDAGNFERYDGPLSCRIQSEKYQYNNSIRMTGKITGSSMGGSDIKTLDDFKRDVIAAYATNRTYTTDSDLQVMFDKTARTTRNRIIFSKKRDDCFERMYNAFLLLKDASGYIIPTNSITCEFFQEDIEETLDDGSVVSKIGYFNDTDIIIKAGTIWKYHDDSPVGYSMEPIYVSEDDGTYYLTTDPVGNVKTDSVDTEGNPLYREIDYLYDEDMAGNRIPVYRRTSDGHVLAVVYPYIYFGKGYMEYTNDLIDTDGNIIDTTDPEKGYHIDYDALPAEYFDQDGLIKDTHALNENNLITRTIDGETQIIKTACKKNTLIVDDEGHIIYGPEHEICYMIQEYGVLRKGIYADGRNLVTDANRKYMAYPDTNFNIITATSINTEERKQILYTYLTKYIEILNNPNASETDKLEAGTVISEYGLHRDGSNLDEVINAQIAAISNTYAYTNPYLIRYNLKTGISAYYKNTFNDVYPLDLTFVEDNSIIQFNASGLSVTRNALFGENYYKLTVSIQPSVADINLRNLLYIDPSPELNQNNTDTYIYAAFDGIVEKFVFIPDAEEGKCGSVYMIIRYFAGSNESISESILNEYFDGDINLQNYIANNFKGSLYETSIITGIRVGSAVTFTKEGTDQKIFNVQMSYTTDLIAGSKFVKGNIIATLRPVDTMQVRIVGMFKNKTDVNNDYYIPFVFETYDQSVDSYNYTAYIKATDEISTKDQLLVNDGIFNTLTALTDDGISIDPENCYFSIGIFVQYDNDNLPSPASTSDSDASDASFNIYRNLEYVRGYTLTNVYENPKTHPVKLLELYRFIRSVSKNQKAVYTSISPDTLQAVDVINTYTELREVPLVRSEWARNPGNVYDLFKLLKTNHDWVSDAYNLLDNNFTINMKFYNTYGKSRYLTIGNSIIMDVDNDGVDDSMMTQLDSVTLRFKFGVKLRALVDSTDFKSRFVNYIRNYVEDFNSVENHEMSIHMSDLYTKLNQKFKDEIRFLEFYGINDYDSQMSQVIETIPYEEINALGYNKYIPEFINLETERIDSAFVPMVDLLFIE